MLCLVFIAIVSMLIALSVVRSLYSYAVVVANNISLSTIAGETVTEVICGITAGSISVLPVANQPVHLQKDCVASKCGHVPCYINRDVGCIHARRSLHQCLAEVYMMPAKYCFYYVS